MDLRHAFRGNFVWPSVMKDVVVRDVVTHFDIMIFCVVAAVANVRLPSVEVGLVADFVVVVVASLQMVYPMVRNMRGVGVVVVVL